MASPPKPNSISKKQTSMASWSCGIVLIVLILLGSAVGESVNPYYSSSFIDYESSVRGNQLNFRQCDEIYIVGEGETLHTISDKCGDPYIVEQNPHIHDPDDVFPGLVIKITPSRHRNL